MRRGEVGKVRPVVVIQADALTEAGLATLLVVPLTSQRRRGAEALRVPIPARDRLLRECWAMAEQPRALDRNRIGATPLTLRLLPQLLRNALASLAMGPDPMSQGFAGGCLDPAWWSGLQLTRHAADKLETYGIDGARLESWRAALERGDPFLDVVTGPLVLVMHWEERPWIVILSKDGDRVVTTYPSDERTVTNRRGAGRWIYPTN